MNVHSNLLVPQHWHQLVECTNYSNNLFNEVLLSNKKPWTTETYTNMDDSHKSYVEGQKPTPLQMCIFCDFIDIKF